MKATDTFSSPLQLLEKYAQAELPTRWGDFAILVFREKLTEVEHLALVRGEVRGVENVVTRLHSECLTSEVLGSLRCDCKAQLDWAMDYIAQRKLGVLIYLRQEGRGIGLGNKIKAYALQQQSGLDTVDANLHLGFPDDMRSYEMAVEILRYLGVVSVALITNNPKKLAGLKEGGIHIGQRISSPIEFTSANTEYLKTKRDKSGHLIQVDEEMDKILDVLPSSKAS
ncbi:MAG: GTP cyclohydrolase II [Proteobacteria bacterium]|nr:GTP cyclohydrolase II [Cystobacterineae bacterium]MCL2259467.1 GTP cyclohydrolase II [Cystobacterineae bacterium]MCL2314054.1 GTP cyclohydrolase II [Pseudomonadota bacterium]